MDSANTNNPASYKNGRYTEKNVALDNSSSDEEIQIENRELLEGLIFALKGIKASIDRGFRKLEHYLSGEPSESEEYEHDLRADESESARESSDLPEAPDSDARGPTDRESSSDLPEPPDFVQRDEWTPSPSPGRYVYDSDGMIVGVKESSKHSR